MSSEIAETPVTMSLSLLGNGERPQLLQLECLHKTFALELIESVLTNSSTGCVSSPLYPSETRMLSVVLEILSCSQYSEHLIIFRHHPFHPASQNAPRALYGIRVTFLLLKQFSSDLDTEAEAFLTLLTRRVARLTPVSVCLGE